MVSSSPRITFANILGTLGYLSVIMQWLWTIIVVAYPFLSGDLSHLFPSAPVPVPPPAAAAPPSPFAVALVIALTVVIFACTFVVLWKLPKTIGRGGGHVTRRTADLLVPLVTHHHKPSLKEHRRLSRRLTQLIKWSLVVLPAIGLLWSQPVGGLSTDIIWIVGAFCLGCSALYFGIQRALVSIWKLPAEQVW